ncbi:hypothetical protein, conserved [Leishmania tarentolae]|uniref:CFA20 domain-containing protein n=1 Tax=Leishmania tarentolae TaxID=5689 RepID=A0A640KD08_LEITA|nr:hypothetical protein, conserved [Leishmania tarentolae]
MNAYFFSHHVPPPPTPSQLVRAAVVVAGGQREGLRQSKQRQAYTSPSEYVRAPCTKDEGCGGANEKAATQPYRGVGDASMYTASTPPAASRVGTAVIGSKPPPNTTYTLPSLRSTVPAASTVDAAPHRAVPCRVLFSPQGPRPLEGLKTVTLKSSGDAAAVASRRGSLRDRGPSLNRLSTGGPPSSAAALASRQSSSGIRCVYDRDTRSQLLHITPGTEADFSSCMRLPALAVTLAPVSGAASTPVLFADTAMHTIVVVQFCVAAPTLSTAARHQADAARRQLPESTILPPGSFYIELVLRASTSSNTARGRSNTKGSDSSGGSGGYRLRFTNTGHTVQRHTHHTKIPLQCIRTAQWVQLFFDLEALLQSCKASGAVVAGGTHFRLQQLRIGSGGSAASTGGIYVRRIIAGHGLQLPHPTIDHLVTAAGVPGVVPLMATTNGFTQEMVRDADGDGHSYRQDSGALQQRSSSSSGSFWAPPEALRLPAEVGESLCVFVRTGDENILSQAPVPLNSTEEQSQEDKMHTRDGNNIVEAMRAGWKESNSAGHTDTNVTEWAEDMTQPAARRQEAHAVTTTLRKPVTLPSSAGLPLYQSQSCQPDLDQQQSAALPNSYQKQPEDEAAAALVGKRQPNQLKVLHHTALELLRMGSHQEQSQPPLAHQFSNSGAAAHSLTATIPPSPFSLSASPCPSPADTSSLSASDDAEMFVVREVSASEQLAPATPPQYPTNQLMTGKPPLRSTPSQPPVSDKAMHHALGVGRTDAMGPLHVGKDAGIGATNKKDFSAPEAVGETGLLFSTTSSNTATAATTPETSVLSVVSYSSAVELIDAMHERVRHIHMILAGMEEEASATAAAAAAASTVVQPLVKPSQLRNVTPPPTAQGARPAVRTATPAAPPLLPPPPPYTDATATHSFSSAPSEPVRTTPAELMEAVLCGMPPDSVASTVAVSNLPPMSPTAAAETKKCGSVAHVAVAEGTATALATPGDTNAILELWSSTERPLCLPTSFQQPATAAAQRAPLAERLHAHQAAPSSSSSAGSCSVGGGGDNGGVHDAPSAVIPPPISAATSWTFHSASLTPQTPSVLMAPTTFGAVGGALPGAGGALPSHTTGAQKGDAAPLSHQAPRPLSGAPIPAPDIGATMVPPFTSLGHVTKAVVWRRPVPVPGHPPSVGYATQRALQDEVRLTDTPLSRRAPTPGAEGGGAGRIVAWSARQKPRPTSSGMHTPLSAALASQLDVAPKQESHQSSNDGGQLYAGAQALPPPPSGGSFSTVSSFQMWLPSSSMPTLSASRGRYPSTITPFSGGGDRHCHPSSDSSSGAGGGPRPPRLGIAAGCSSARPPMPHPSVARMPQADAAERVTSSSAVKTVGSSPIAQQQQQREQPTTFGFSTADSAGTPPQHTSMSHHEAPLHDAFPSEKVGKGEGRYVYDGVLQCYLDLETNAYVDKM